MAKTYRFNTIDNDTEIIRPRRNKRARRVERHVTKLADMSSWSDSFTRHAQRMTD